VTGNEIQIAIPKDKVGLQDKNVFTLDFKWVDNSKDPANIMDYYVNGDVAPDGRFKYRFIAE